MNTRTLLDFFFKRPYEKHSRVGFLRKHDDQVYMQIFEHPSHPEYQPYANWSLNREILNISSINGPKIYPASSSLNQGGTVEKLELSNDPELLKKAEEAENKMQFVKVDFLQKKPRTPFFFPSRVVTNIEKMEIKDLYKESRKLD